MPVKKTRIAEEIIEEREGGKKERCLLYHDDYIAVKGIKNGTVIDHINVGQGRGIYADIEKLCGLKPNQNAVILQGAPSERMGHKDKIKIMGYFMPQNKYKEFVQQFTYNITFSHIKNYKVVLKFRGTKKVDLEDKLD
ncbi:MAG: aspartate carbamoyltransferase regulatory subunit [archaeon]